MTERYEIRLAGHLDARWTTWFDGLTVSQAGATTVIAGEVPDQAALHGLLQRVRDLGLPLISVTRTAAAEPDRPDTDTDTDHRRMTDGPTQGDPT